MLFALEPSEAGYWLLSSALAMGYAMTKSPSNVWRKSYGWEMPDYDNVPDELYAHAVRYAG